MAPRGTPKRAVKVQPVVKDMPAKGRASPVGAIKKTTVMKKPVDKTPLKINNTTTSDARVTRQRTSTVPTLATPKPKENKAVPIPSSVTKSGKKPSWKRRPKPAHSGVPIPEKMRKLMEKQFLDSEFVL
ncbi:uncharacterized protein LOC118268281 [Spodoptera frugiperda]|uniref:Uncharacterized protein LOC118268281 n=1 Tax=Spodoptera frugiperda TaxID=7108 RepID=A0A9R0D370_SPOFR|nr:uncharacterized protein LOC118268281 [Spodoptera frugiperda]